MHIRRETCSALHLWCQRAWPISLGHTKAAIVSVGGSGVDEAMFYSYAYSEPEGFRSFPVKPDAARFDEGLGEFLLPYAAVQSSSDPAATLLQFLQSTYEAAADGGHWNRAALDCDLGRARIPRPVLG